MEMFTFICIGTALYMTIRAVSYRKYKEGVKVKYIDAPKEESEDDKVDRLISILEGVCDELEDMR
jgi:hypothetical protein